MAHLPDEMAREGWPGWRYQIPGGGSWLLSDLTVEGGYATNGRSLRMQVVWERACSRKGYPGQQKYLDPHAV